MDTLDKIVNDNRDQFYSEMPYNGHFERFQEKLYGQNTVKHLTLSRYWYSIAAVLLVLIATSIVFFKSHETPSKPEIANNLPVEYHEISDYYGTIINAKFNEARLMDKNSRDKELFKKLSNELKDLDKSQQEILEDARENPNDPMVMNAFMNSYKIKIELIDRTIVDYRLVNNNKKYIQV